MLWGFGNYSRFVRPGYKRVKIDNIKNSTLNKDFLFSAYKDPSTGKLVTVIVNSGNDAVPVLLKNKGNRLNKLKAYITSADKDLDVQKVDNKLPFAIPSQSIVTIVSE